MLKFVALLFLVLQLCTAEAEAQSQFKRRFFDGCETAREAFKSLEGVERQEALSFMARVLGLQGELPSDGINSAATINQTAIVRDNPLLNRPQFGLNNRSSRSALGEFYSEERSAEAKKCALELLNALAPESAVALPELIESWAKTRGGVESGDAVIIDLVSKLVNQLKQSEILTPGEETINRLIKLLADRNSRPLAENVLVEWKAYSLPLMLEQLSGPEGAELRRLLLRLDPQGMELLPNLRRLLDSSESEKKLAAIKLLGRSSLGRFQAVCDILPFIQSPEETLAEEARRYLSSVLANAVYLEGCAGREDLVVSLLTSDSPQLQEFGLRLSEQAMLDADVLSRELLRKYESASPLVKSHILRLLRGSAEPKVRDLLGSAIYSKELELEALKLFPESSLKPEVRASTLLRRYKAATAELDLERRRQLVMTLVKVVAQDGQIPNKARFIPLFLDSLSLESKLSPEEHPGVYSLIPLSEEALKQLLRFREASDNLRAERADYILEESLLPAERESIFERALNKTLTGPAKQRERGRFVLKRVSLAMTKKEFERSIGRRLICANKKGDDLKDCKEPCEVQRLAYLLGHLRSRTEETQVLQFASVLDEACWSSSTCGEWQLLAEVLPESRASSQGLVEGFAACFKRASDVTEFESLLNSSQQLSGSLGVSLREKLLDLLAPESLPPEFQLEILSQLIKDGRPIGEFSKIMKLLPSGDSELDRQVIELFNEAGGTKFDPGSKSFFDADVQNPVLKGLLKSVWANHSENQDWVLQLLASVDGLKGEEAGSLFSLLSNARLVSVLTKARTRDENTLLLEEMVSRISRGQGEGLREALPKILELAKEDTSRIRSKALYLAFALNSARSEIAAMFEAELQGPEGDKLLEFKYPPQCAELLLAWQKGSKSEVLKLEAKRLLENNILLSDS